MDQDLVKRRHRELSMQQAKFVAARERGIPRQKSAIMAGYPDVDKKGREVESQPTVQRELAQARKELAEMTGITREEVIQGLRDAAEMAQTMADPATMVRAWAELGKLLGYYAPDKKVHELTLNKSSIEAIRRLSDTELHRLAKGRLIDGTTGEVLNGGD
jgi:D-alanyl-D-alanine dipeptidase